MVEEVTIGFTESNKNAIEEQKMTFTQQQKLDSKARFLIYQCVNSKIINKISKASTSKEAWDILEKTYGDGEKNKIKLQRLRSQYELLTMEDKESIANYFDRIQQVVHKILRTLHHNLIM